MGVLDRKNREKENKKNLILAAAINLFKEKGFENTTVDEIAEKAEIGKGTVYFYFKSKEEIYITIINSELDTLIKRLKTVSELNELATTKLEKIFDTYIAFHNEYSGIVGSFLENCNSTKSNFRISDLITGLKNRANERFEIINSIILEGVKNNEFKKINAEKTTKIFLSLMIGLITSTEINQIEELSNYKEYIFDIFFNGIKYNKEE